MSDNWIILIPTEPNYVPSKQAQQLAIAYCKEIAPLTDEIASEATEQISFFNCGANFHRILCPACGSEIELDWWSELLNQEFEDDFPLKNYALPCCQIERNLNELNYDWSQGFARFSIRARNPGLAAFPEANRQHIEEILGCKLKVIWQHL